MSSPIPPARLRTIALLHRLQTLAALFMIIACCAWGFAKDSPGVLPDILTPAVLKLGASSSVIVAAFVSIVLAWYSAGVAGFIVVALLSFIPGVNFLAWVVINVIATKQLRNAGAKVGVIGVSAKSLPDN
jgi:uncharacterized membrane protein